MEVYNKCGELCHESGMKFGYHNHHFEFNQEVNGQKLYDIILGNTDPNMVMQQLDFGNMVNGDAMAREWIEKYPGRFPSVHVKDMIKSEVETEEGGEALPYESAILGAGIVGVRETIDLLKETGGTTQFIIEQESYQDKTPMECVQKDLEIMGNWGY
jgi:sugar phosphate isomerase/epimerase